ncbi:hypothetical protein Tco_0365135 [Tanacetum coccineum]
MENTGNGKDKLSHKITTLIYITTTDKHGVPPTKRLFRVAMLDPSQGFIDPWGKFGDLELPSVMIAARFGSFSINNFEVKFLEEENPPEQSRLGILFCKEILKGGMVRMHYAFVHDESTEKMNGVVRSRRLVIGREIILENPE